MSFYDVLIQYGNLSSAVFDRVTSFDVERALSQSAIGVDGLLALLSPAAEAFLEPMARKAHEMTLRCFGRTIQLYTPIYVSNYCENCCIYCGFNARNRIDRKRLSLEEVDREAALIAATGLKHILLLTGESRQKSPVGYMRDCVEVLKKYFSAIAVEVYPLTEPEYGSLVSAGVDGLTIYQETYDEALYSAVHLAGPKRDFRFRLDAPERGARSGMRQVSIGALLGLADWRREVFLMGLHAQYLQDRYSGVDIGMSLPRLRPHAGQYAPAVVVTDRDFVQIIVALRLFMPRIGISVSTRETAQYRENLIPLGITRMSAGSTTHVGGHTIGASSALDHTVPQFEIADNRSVSDIATMIQDKGYDPVFKDWTILV